MLPKSRLGPYEILSRIGAGGMGEVYKAVDTRIQRIVAIKISNARFSERFEREARAISSLNHPNICALHDVGEQDGATYLVMEYIDGKPLEGPLPVEKLIRYGSEIASALDCAHRHGITHRDLKPANILVTPNGIKLLDFGLAKIAAPQASDATVTQALTSEGAILGTFQYMSPEQLEGKEADARSDIWGLGVVLYEAATGRKAFDGSTQASIIGSILHSQPAPVNQLQPSLPAGLDRILRRMLAKDPDERWQSARDVLHALRDLDSEVDLKREAPRRGSGWIWKAAFAVLVCAGFLMAALSYRRSPAAVREEIRFQIEPPRGTRLRMGVGTLATVSPDGRMIFFRAYEGAGSALWLRTFVALESSRIAGSEAVTAAAWSPDSRSIAFLADGKVKRFDIGGTVGIVASAPNALTLAWAADETLLIGNAEGPLMRVRTSGGGLSPLTKLDAGRAEVAHESPFVLPGRRRFLFRVRSAKPEHDGVYAGDIEGANHSLVAGATNSRTFAGFSFNIRAESAFAQRLDSGGVSLIGDTYPLPEASSLSLSEIGVLAYTPPAGSASSEVIVTDARGAQLGAFQLSEAGQFGHPEFSPDGKRILVDFSSARSRNTEIWSLDLGGGAPSRLTFDGGAVGVWSPDGEYVYYSGGTETILRVSSGGGKPERVASEDAHHKTIGPGQDQMIFSTGSPFRPSIRALKIGSAARSVLLLAGIDSPQFSPDGKWLAYDSQLEGESMVFVETWPIGKGKWLISPGGGAVPRWRGDGKEIFYLDDTTIFSVPIEIRGGAVIAGAPKKLLAIPPGPGGVRFDVTRDGQRFAYVRPLRDSDSPRINVVLNWAPAMAAR